MSSTCVDHKSTHATKGLRWRELQSWLGIMLEWLVVLLFLKSLLLPRDYMVKVKRAANGVGAEGKHGERPEQRLPMCA